MKKNNTNTVEGRAETIETKLTEVIFEVHSGQIDRLVASSMAQLAREVTNSVKVQNERKKIALMLKKVPKRKRRAA